MARTHGLHNTLACTVKVKVQILMEFTGILSGKGVCQEVDELSMSDFVEAIADTYTKHLYAQHRTSSWGGLDAQPTDPQSVVKGLPGGPTITVQIQTRKYFCRRFMNLMYCEKEASHQITIIYAKDTDMFIPVHNPATPLVNALCQACKGEGSLMRCRKPETHKGIPQWNSKVHSSSGALWTVGQRSSCVIMQLNHMLNNFSFEPTSVQHWQNCHSGLAMIPQMFSNLILGSF
ncbi:hypothetical protein J3A83DRAFT_4187924 [Scleroderma citrinum]